MLLVYNSHAKVRVRRSMTIQVAVSNAYGVALASDRHVYRHGQTLSTGRQTKLARLRGPVPAAMMSAGSFSVLGFPVSRMALQFEQALAASHSEGPDGMAQAVLRVLERPLDVKDCTDESPGHDLQALARAAELVVGRAMAYGDAGTGLEKLLDEIARTPRCQGCEEVEELGRSVWHHQAGKLPEMAASPSVAEALSSAPRLLGEAVIGALVHGWSRPADVNLTVGLCCPDSGVPAVVAVNIWKGLGRRLLFAARHDRAYYALHRAGRSLVISQGSGRGNVCAMIEGVSENADPEQERADRTAAIDRRWQRAHDRIGVSSPAELVGIAAGLVRGAEVIGYLTGDDEGSVADIDAMLVTPQGLAAHTLTGTPDGLSPC
jgi:hypothetical protein